MADINEIINALKFRQELKKGGAIPSEEIRIGKRNPNDGTYEARRANGNIERAIRTSNGGTTTNQIVRGIQADNNLWGLDWRNVAQPRPTPPDDKIKINFVYLYSKIESIAGETLRYFYVAGTIKPAKIKELTCTPEWNISAHINLKKDGYFINVKYSKPRIDPESKLIYAEDETYIIQYRSDKKTAQKIKSEKTLPLHYVGGCLWWCPPTIPFYGSNSASDGNVQNGVVYKTVYDLYRLQEHFLLL